MEAGDERLRLVSLRRRVAERRELVRRPARRERREEREAERAADLLRRVEEAGREPRVVGGDAARRDQRDRDEDEPHADGREEDPREQVGQVRAVRREAQEREQPGRGEREPDQRHLARAERRNEPLRESGADDHPGGERDERESRLERREPEHALDVERVEEEHREEAGCDDEHRHVRAAHGPAPRRSRGGRAARPSAARSARTRRAARPRARGSRAPRRSPSPPRPSGRSRRRARSGRRSPWRPRRGRSSGARARPSTRGRGGARG